MITDKVKSFEDACAVLGIAPESVIPYANPKDQEEVATNAYRKLTTIAKALNENLGAPLFELSWIPEFQNTGSKTLSYTEEEPLTIFAPKTCSRDSSPKS